MSLIFCTLLSNMKMINCGDKDSVRELDKKNYKNIFEGCI